MEEPKRIYTTILIKRRVSGDPGPPSTLQRGELAMNEVDNTLYLGSNQTQNLSGNTVTDMGAF
jgi:hypothetical protein